MNDRLAGSKHRVFWLDTPDRPAPRPSLPGDIRCDLAVVGGGFSGLWTALLAKEADPTREVILLERGRLGDGASGRNGGFCSASLTHGRANGVAHFGDEERLLSRLGSENLDAIESAINRYGIDCGFERSGTIDVATQPYQLESLDAADGDLLDGVAVRRELDSPTFLGGVWDRTGTAMVDPARLVWGLAQAAERIGVRIFENTPVIRLRGSGPVRLLTPSGPIDADRVALATNVFRPLLRRIRPYVVPVYDYVLMTEPLTKDQLERIGWTNRQGFSDLGNQFHYFRLTADNRILWGGYDAIYHFGRRTSPVYEDRPATYGRLADQFAGTFPQLAEIGFSHRWAGAIDTCTRFCPFFGTVRGGTVAYALGFTGLGVGASRFGAQVMLDLLDGVDSERARLRMVQRRPLPFPPEPLTYLGVQATRWSLARADEHEGHRNLWLRALDRLGAGFDS